MKRIITILTLAFIYTLGAFSEDYVLSRIECYDMEYNTSSPRETAIYFYYREDKDEYYLYREGYLDEYYFLLTNDDLVKLRDLLIKAKDWAKLAKQNKSDVVKDLPASPLTIKVLARDGDDIYSTNKLKIIFNFMASPAENGAEAIGLTVYSEPTSSIQNKYIDIEFTKVLFIGEEGIDDFIKAISPTTIMEGIKKHKQKIQDNSIFN